MMAGGDLRDQYAAHRDKWKYQDMIVWREVSAPSYEHAMFTVAAVKDDRVKLIGRDGGGLWHNMRQMSYASWFIAIQAKIGGEVFLKIRVDPLARFLA